MVLYDKNRNPQLYEKKDLMEISIAISNIAYTKGVINTVLLEENPTVENLNIAKQLAKELIEKDIKEYEKIVPEEIKKQFDINRLERICKIILEK